MKKTSSFQEAPKTATKRINIKDVVISNVSTKLYNYKNRKSEINALAESISEIGQQQPITVLKKKNKFIILDGVLRLKAMIGLNLNEIDVIICEFPLTNEFSIQDLIIHHQIKKQKSDEEKFNEIRTLLRIDSDNKNPLRDKEKRVALITFLMGTKGWGRNNVFSLEKIMRWELEISSRLSLSRKVITNEINVKRALDTMQLFIEQHGNHNEDESKILKGFIKGDYSAERAVDLINTYEEKKADSQTVIDLHPIETEKFRILKGNIEEIQLPEDLQIDTIFTSPPYYRLVKYGNDPNELGWEKTPDEYVKRLADILMKGYGKLKDTGSMFVNLGESYKSGKCMAITERLTIELISRGVNYVDRLIWKKDGNKPYSNRVKRLNPGYETILHFSKSRNYHYEQFKIASDKKLKVSRGCKEKGSDKKSFHIPNNYNQFRSVLTDNEVSNILTVQINKNRTKHIKGEEEHPATFSSNLPVIPLLTSTPKDKGSIVFDPFMGSGSCGVTAVMLGFHFVGVELYDKNIKTAARVLNESLEIYDEDQKDSLLKECIPFKDKDETDRIQEAA